MRESLGASGSIWEQLRTMHGLSTEIPRINMYAVWLESTWSHSCQILQYNGICMKSFFKDVAIKNALPVPMLRQVSVFMSFEVIVH